MCTSVWKNLAVFILVLLPLRGAGQDGTGLRSPQLVQQVEQLAKDKSYVDVVYDFLTNYADTLKALRGKEVVRRMEYGWCKAGSTACIWSTNTPPSLS